MQHAFGAANAGPYWMGDCITLVDLTFVPWFEQSPMLEGLLGFTWPSGSDRLRQSYDHRARRPTVKAESRPAEFYLHEYGKLMQHRATQ